MWNQTGNKVVGFKNKKGSDLIFNNRYDPFNLLSPTPLISEASLFEPDYLAVMFSTVSVDNFGDNT